MEVSCHPGEKAGTVNLLVQLDKKEAEKRRKAESDEHGIEFTFNLQSDKPEEVAKEMVSLARSMTSLYKSVHVYSFFCQGVFCSFAFELATKFGLYQP